MPFIIACTEEDMDLSDMEEYERRERAHLSPHTDCSHVEFDLLDVCRMCQRHRSLCEPEG